MQTLSTVSKNAPALVDAGVHESIIRCMSKHKDSLPLQQISIATLSNLALHRSTGTVLMRASTHLAVLEAVRRFDDAALAECTATCMANLANSRAFGVRAELMKQGVHQLCIRCVGLAQFSDPTAVRAASRDTRQLTSES